MTELEWDWGYKKLVEMRIATVKNDKYVYSKSFESTIAHLNSNPPGKIQSLKIARMIQRDIMPLLFQQVRVFKSKVQVELTMIAYLGLKTHCMLLDLDFPEKGELANIVWAIYWLNDHNPRMDEEEE